MLAVPPSEYTCGYIYDNSSSITLYITDFTNVIAAYTAGVFAQYGTGTAYDVLYTPYSSFPYISLNDTAVGVVFDAANAVVPIYTGFYAGTNTTVEYQLNTVADVIGSCISGTSTDCQTLFDNTAQGNFSTTEPANTWQAMLSIAQDPTGNVANQYALIASTPPWSPYNSGGAPSSWAITQSTTTPIISSIASATPPGPANAYNITGYNLADCTTSTYPTVVYNGSNAPVGVPSSCVAGTSNIIATPPPAGSEVVGVFLEGDFSNLLLLP